MAERLADGAVRSTQLFAEARLAGITEKTLRRAGKLERIEARIASEYTAGEVRQFFEWSKAGTEAARKAHYQAVLKALGKDGTRGRVKR